MSKQIKKNEEVVNTTETAASEATMQEVRPDEQNPLPSAKMFDTLVAKAAAVAEAQNAGKSKTDVDALKKSAKNALNEYNNQVTKECYQRMAKAGNAVKTALTVRYVNDVKKIKYKTDATTGKVSAEIAADRAKADLPMMQKVIGVEHFADPQWLAMAEKLAFLTANAINSRLSNSATFNYPISDTAKAFDFAADADPTSNKSVLKALQKCVDSILYIPSTNKKGETVNLLKVEGQHWVYIRECMTRQGQEVGDVIVGNTGKIAELIADVISMIINGKRSSLIVGG